MNMYIDKQLSTPPPPLLRNVNNGQCVHRKFSSAGFTSPKLEFSELSFFASSNINSVYPVKPFKHKDNDHVT